jgi:uncharacterized protein (PEP-CTERM system associated)
MVTDMATVRSIARRSSNLGLYKAVVFTSALVILPVSVQAQTWRIVPQLSFRESYSDNVEFASNELAQSRLISDVSTGILIERLGPRASFLIDYRLRSFFYAGESRLNNSQNFLNSRGTFELLENWMFVDTRANISQQSNSAFTAPAATDGVGASANQTETRTYQISPYFRGLLADKAIYQLRYNNSGSRTEDSAVESTRHSEWLALLASSPNAGRLGWLIDGSVQQVNNDEIGKRKNNRVRASLIYPLVPTLTISVVGGYEENNLLNQEDRSGPSNGFGLEWNPGPRTRLVATGEKRFFGNGYNVSFSHRTPLTAWRLSTSRDVVLAPNATAAANQISVVELISDILSSSIPDPAARAAAVGQRLGQAGVPAASAPSSGFLTSRPTLNRRQDGSFAILGTRSTITLAWSRRDQRTLDAGDSLADAIALEEDVRQTTMSTSWIYRLTPLSSLNLSFSRSRSEGLSAAGFESEQRLQGLSLTTSLGPRIAASLGIRRDRFDSTRAASYRENSITGSLSVRF